METVASRKNDSVPPLMLIPRSASIYCFYAQFLIAIIAFTWIPHSCWIGFCCNFRQSRCALMFPCIGQIALYVITSASINANIPFLPIFCVYCFMQSCRSRSQQRTVLYLLSLLGRYVCTGTVLDLSDLPQSVFFLIVWIYLCRTTKLEVEK